MKIKILPAIFLLCTSVIIQVTAQSTDKNYILTQTFLNRDKSSSIDIIQYYDGLGRENLNIQKQISPSGNDIVTMQQYDSRGKLEKSWIETPFEGNNGRYIESESFKSTAVSFHPTYYNAYDRNIYETSPIGRISQQMHPIGSKFQKYESNKNDYDYKCRHYDINENTGQIIDHGYYPSGSLLIEKVSNWNSEIKLTFTNKYGQTIMTSQGDKYESYYLYDKYGNLRYVLPPMIKEDISKTNLDLFAYCYTYDERNICIEKKLPGCDPVKYVYDKSGQMILSQDGRQRNGNIWQFTLYDPLGRETVSGICSSPDLESIRNNTIISSFGVNENLSGTQYSVNLTLNITKILSVNYYDNHDF